MSGEGDALAESAWLAEQEAGRLCSWEQYLRQSDDQELLKAIRRRERTGRPKGDEPFLRKIGHLLGRALAPKRPGPAPKKQETKQR